MRQFHLVTLFILPTIFTLLAKSTNLTLLMLNTNPDYPLVHLSKWKKTVKNHCFLFKCEGCFSFFLFSWSPVKMGENKHSKAKALTNCHPLFSKISTNFMLCFTLHMNPIFYKLVEESHRKATKGTACLWTLI